MIAYLDSSVVLRVVLGQRGRLKEWKRIKEGVASAIVGVECLRTLDRLRLRERIEDEKLVARRESIYRLMDEFSVVYPGRVALEAPRCRSLRRWAAISTITDYSTSDVQSHQRT